MFKWRIFYTDVTKLLQFIINVSKSHSQLRCMSPLAWEVRVLFVWVDHVFYSGSSIQNASEHFVSWTQLSFLTAFFIQPLKRNCNRVRSEYLNNSISVTIPNCTHGYSNVSSHNYQYYHLPKYWPSSRITLHIMVQLLTHFMYTYMDEFPYIQTEWRKQQTVHIYLLVHAQV
jgi:hypothetical protein